MRGFDQDGADYDGRTAMHLAAAEGREPIVRYLVENGAEVNPKDRWGGSPLDDALRHGHAGVAEILAQHRGVRTQGSQMPERRSDESQYPQQIRFPEDSATVELIYAASEGDLCAVQRMIALGVPLTCADYDLRTPLHLASAQGHEHIVQYFIDHDVPLSPRDRWEGTPLSDARRHGHPRVSQLLENHGAVS